MIVLGGGRPVERETRYDDGRARRRRAAPAHERDDEPAEAGAAAPPEPRRVGADDRRLLRARRRRRLVLRDAALPRARPRRVDARRARGRRQRWSCRGASRRARFWPQLASSGVTWFSAGPTLHQMLLERDDGERRRRRALRFARSCSSALSPALLRARRGDARRADARGVRHDGGEPPDGVEPAPAGRAQGRLGRHPDRRRRSASSTPMAATCSAGEAARSRSAGRA